MATIFTDTFTGADAAAWSTTNWTIFSSTAQTVDILTNRGRIFSSSTASNSYGTNAIDKFTARADQEILVTITTAGTTQNIFVGVKAVATGPGIGNISSGAILQIKPAASGTLLIQRSASASTTLVTDARTLATNTQYNVRLQIIGTTVKYKIWLTSGAEPGTWDQTATIASIPNGNSLIGRQYTATTGGAAVYFDDVTVTDANNVAPVAGGYTAQVMTASADTPNAVASITKSASYSAQVMTADASATNAGAGGAFRRWDIIEDLPATTTGNGYKYFKLPAPNVGSGEVLVGATLYVDATVTSAFGVDVTRITADWTEAGGGTPTTGALVYSNTYNFTAGSFTGIDVTNVFAATNYGAAVYLPSIYNSEDANAARRPYVVYEVATPASANPSAPALTATAAMPDPVTSGTKTVSASGQPMTASAAMPGGMGAGTVLISVSNPAEHMDAYADSPPAAFSMPVTVAANPMTAGAESEDVQAGTTQGVIYEPKSLDATARWVRPTVNGNIVAIAEDEDRYFGRVMGDVPRQWFRLNDHGSTAADRVGLVATSGTYHGVLVGQYEAPEGRHSVYFNGSASLEQNPPMDGLLVQSGVLLSTLEFSIRTSKPNSFLLAGVDGNATNTNPQNNTQPATEVYLRDGRIAYKNWFDPDSLGYQKPPQEFKGFKNLADGQWHHIIIKGGTYRYAERGVEIWVDGKLEVRRVNANAMWGFPDWIGSRPAELRGRNLGALPGSLNFVGDMTELVFYGHDDVNDDDIPRHYYAFMGWNPIDAKPMEAFAFTPAGAAGRGNQKRALYLFWSNEHDRYNVGGDGNNGKMSFDPIPYANRDPNGQVLDYGGYKVFTRSIINAPIAGSFRGVYRDEVTDAPSLIDLKRHVNLDDYDLIMFADWPDEGSEFDDLNEFPNFGAQYARLLSQLRDANDQGIGLFITVPRLAIDLGIVDRVDAVPTLAEHRFSNGQGNAYGYYDYGSAYKFPWNIAGNSGLEGNPSVYGSSYNGQPVNRDPSFLAAKAYYYEDTNSNNKFRVRAQIEGLTDIPSYMLAEQVHQADFNVYGWDGIAKKYLHRMEGLRIGDEYIFHGAEIFDNPAADYSDVRLGRYYGYFATPVANVKAGTVVTTFGAKHWLNENEVDNPYRNYATTIVLRPGDVLDGRPVGGKIYVNFTEAPGRQREFVYKQVLPTDGNWPARYNPDTPEQKEWEYSWTRHSLTNTQSQGQAISYVDPLGNLITVQTAGSGLSMVRSSEIFPLQAFPSYNMNMRALFWLREGVETTGGSNTAAAAPVEASAAMPNAVAAAQRDGGYRAEPMNALAEVKKVAEDHTGAVEIHTLPMTAAATWTGYGRTIKASPMTATAEMLENFDAVHTTGEQIVLTLRGVDVTLFMKEDA